MGAGVLLGLLTAAALWGAWRGQRWLAVGWFWYVGTLLPVIGLVQVNWQVMADRFLYLPQIGICVALVWGGADRLRGGLKSFRCHWERGRGWGQVVGRWLPSRPWSWQA